MRTPRNQLTYTCLMFMITAVCGLAAPAETVDGKQVSGWVERVRIYPGDLQIRAKLDTGAKRSR
jgi:hypothetical protein